MNPKHKTYTIVSNTKGKALFIVNLRTLSRPTPRPHPFTNLSRRSFIRSLSIKCGDYNLQFLIFMDFLVFYISFDVAATPERVATTSPRTRLGGGELGDGLGALRDSVLGKLSGEHEADGGLDLPGGKGGLLVVLGELSGLSGDALEDVVDEGVHDGHSLLGDSGVGVDLLEDLVDVGAVALDTLLGFLSSGLLGGLGGFLAGGLGHFDKCLRRGREGERVRKG